MRFKNIIKPVAFIGIFCVILSSLSFFFVKKTIKDGIITEPENTIDYLVIGDSEAFSSISPMEIWNKHGFTGYNLGSSAQRLQETYYSLEKALETQKPKVVMLETNAFYRSFGLYSESTRIFESVLKKVFPVYQYHNRWKDFSVINSDHSNNTKKAQEVKSNILKGFRYNLKVNPYTKGPYVKETDKVAKVGKSPRYYLNKIVELCRENNIELILYTVPSPFNWNYERHNAIAEFAKENNLPLVDLNLKDKEVQIDWSKDTFDKGDHLNYFGAQKVTEYMGEYLSKNTNLTDHRKDEKYSKWNEDWNEYLKINKER